MVAMSDEKMSSIAILRQLSEFLCKNDHSCDENCCTTNDHDGPLLGLKSHQFAPANSDRLGMISGQQPKVRVASASLPAIYC